MPTQITSPTTLVSLDDGRVQRVIRTYRLSRAGASAKRVAQPRFRIGASRSAELTLDDPKVSRLHAEICIVPDGYRIRDLGSTNGTWVDGYRVGELYLPSQATVQLGDTTLAFEALGDEAQLPLHDGGFGGLVGESAAMRELFALAARVARADVTVLIEGESGTGKEGVAEALHAQSPRADGPFVVFDCAATPPSLIESELFGHVKGAFTGAVAARAGRLEQAHGGTLLLDEIGELPLEIQAKLLRVLERREVRRLGGNETNTVDVRFLAATHRDLASEVNAGAFREDLYYRLAVVRLHVPPLRERAGDVRRLVEHFLARLGVSPKRRAAIDEAEWGRLAERPWRGNVRELRNAVERTLALAGDGPLHFELAARRPPPRSAGPDLDRPFREQRDELLAHFERTYLRGLLERHDGNVSRAAEAAGLDRAYFKRLLKRSGG